VNIERKFRFKLWLYENPVYQFVWVRLFALIGVAGSICRYIRGTIDRLRMGMTLKQATDRSHRAEIMRIEDMIRQEENEALLARRRLEKIEAFLFEARNGNV
jgi:hypothetical protein